MHNTLYRRADRVASRVIGSDTVLVTESGLDVKVLNETGTYIWQTLAAPSSFEQVLSALVGEFATAEAQARTDVTQFLEALVERGLIERIDGESP